MPFSPLPATLTDDLQRRSGVPVLELGCGEGDFTAVLAGHGATVWTLDRRGPAFGVRPDVVGDALLPPWRTRFDLVVVANLWRHLASDLPPCGPTMWRDLVAPGGALWILEDAPCAAPASARNYRDLQRWLAALQPGARGDLRSRAEFARIRDAWSWPGSWSVGEAENTWPASADRTVAWLREGRPARGSATEKLIGAIEAEGLCYGRFWWARWSAEATAR